MGTRYVHAGEDLQAILDEAQPGDILEIEAQASWAQDLLFREKPGDGPPISLTCAQDQMPRPGNRVTEEHAAGFPRLIGNHKTMPKAANWQHHGIYFGAYANSYTGGTLDLGGSGINGDIVVSVESDLPRNWVVDRCWLQADPNAGGKRGIAANCANFECHDSVIAGYWSDFQDTQAIGSWNAPGPFLIVNNKLEASGENIMFGGACPAIPNLVPSDITITGNWLYKPDSWRTEQMRMRRIGGRLRSTKSKAAVKNLFEIKNGRKVKLEGNILEGCWSSAQAGFAIQLTVRTCEAGNYPWAVVQEVSIRNNLIISENGINILGCDGNRSGCTDPQPVAGSAETILISQNDIRANWLFQLLSGVQKIRIDHDSCTTNYGAVMAFDSVPDSEQMTDMAVHNNLISFGSGIVGTGSGPGTQALDMFFDAWSMVDNAFFNVPSSELWWITDPVWYPAGNHYVVTREEVPAGDFGCDTAALEHVLQHVRDGQTAGSTPNPGPLATLTVTQPLAVGTYQVVAA